MVDTRGWGHFLLSGLPHLDELLPAAWHARRSDPGQVEARGLISIIYQFQPLQDGRSSKPANPQLPQRSL